MARVVEAAGVKPGDVVLEVGAGTGGLSGLLLDAGAWLVAVEIDTHLEPILRSQLGHAGQRATLIIGDVLASKHVINPEVEAQLHHVFAQAHRGPTTHERQRQPLQHPQASQGPTRFKLVANLPYNIASPLLANLAIISFGRLCLTDAVVMVQREVAQRLCAPPGGKDYGPLGVLIQAVYHVEPIATVKPVCFWPQPKVDSAVVRLTRRAGPLTDNPQALSQTLGRLFTHRRKQVRSILGVEQGLPAEIDPHVRPERLTVEQWVALSGWLEQMA